MFCATFLYQNTLILIYLEHDQIPKFISNKITIIMTPSLILKKTRRSSEGYEFNEYPDPFTNPNQA